MRRTRQGTTCRVVSSLNEKVGVSHSEYPVQMDTDDVSWSGRLPLGVSRHCGRVSRLDGWKLLVCAVVKRSESAGA